jgi:3-phosphoshikimate 1-carboxyvinyltransferase
MRIRPARRIAGRVRLPGDKSISHRAAIVAALANGNSSISNFATGADCASTLSCLRALGVSIRQTDTVLSIEGVGPNGLRPTTGTLDCGNSGSTMRMLAGVIAGQNFEATLIGDKSLSARPMNRVIEPLELMGTKVESNDGRPPLTISGTPSLKSIRYELPVASAQVKSCILFAALNASGQTRITERLGASRDHTERMLEWFGVPVTQTMDGANPTITINGPARCSAREVTIPGDVSSAAFFVAAAALVAGSDLAIEDVGLNPTRTGFLSLMQSLGAGIQISEQDDVCNEPAGRIQVAGRMKSASSLSGHQLISGRVIAQLIDELPLLAVVGTRIPGGIEIRDAQELRFKESDRINATILNLRAMGAEVEEFDDGLRVNFGPLRGARILSQGDHRIAMAFTIAALIAEGESEIEDSDCVGVSFPEFFGLLESVVER